MGTAGRDIVRPRAVDLRRVLKNPLPLPTEDHLRALLCDEEQLCDGVQPDGHKEDDNRGELESFHGLSWIDVIAQLQVATCRAAQSTPARRM